MRGYYGWVVVGVALVVLTLVMGTTFHSFGVFVRPVSEEFGLSRADANTGLILFNVGSALWAPLIGKMLDRLSIRHVMAVCAVLMGGSLALLGLSNSLWFSAFVLAVPLAIGAQGAGTLTATTLVARWFNVYRGRAMAIALFGMSLAGVLVTPAIAYGVEHFSWRQTLTVAGGVLSALLLVLVILVRDRPGENDVESTKAAPAATASPEPATPLSALAILASPQFWIMGLTCGLTLAFTNAVMVSLAPLAEDMGVPPTQAASLIAIMAAAGFLGGIVAAGVSDRIDRTLLIVIMFVLMAGVGGVLLVSHGFALVALGAGLLGLVAGIASPAFHALVADRFGAASFGTAYGLMSMLMTLLGAMTVRFAGEVFDRTGGYDLLYISIIVAELIAAAILFATRVRGAAASGATAAAH